MFYSIPVVNVNSVDPDQMLHYVASDVGLHLSLLWDARLKWVNVNLSCLLIDQICFSIMRLP